MPLAVKLAKAERCYVSRILPEEVVEAYKATGLIPIRLAWSTTDNRGGCAIDALAQHYGVCTDDLRKSLDKRYEDGFLLAWDSDAPTSSDVIKQVKSSVEDDYRKGYCDGLICRKAVEKNFSSAVIPIHDESESES